MRELDGLTNVRSSQSHVHVLPAVHVVPHVHQLTGPHHAPGPSVADVSAREGRARAVLLARPPALLQAHRPVHVRVRAVGQLHPLQRQEAVVRAVEARLPDAPVPPVPEGPSLQVLRLEPERAVAHRRGVRVADPVGAALAVIVALILGSVPSGNELQINQFSKVEIPQRKRKDKDEQKLVRIYQNKLQDMLSGTQVSRWREPDAFTISLEIRPGLFTW